MNLKAVTLRPRSAHRPAENRGHHIPTELDWTLPKGVKLADAKWPELNYFGQPPGYQDKVIVRAKFQAARDLKPGTKLRIGVRSSWQVCKGICKLGAATKLVKVAVSK